MNSELLYKIVLLLLTGIFMVSCSEVKNSRYKDTRDLEIPPKLEIVEKLNVVGDEKESIKESGLGAIVTIAGSTEKPVIKIKKLFDRSWNIVESALKLSEIEITDKNREQGVFYVLFDPDAQSSDNSTVFDTLTFSLFEDSDAAVALELIVIWRDNNTEVSAEPVNQEDNDLLNDDEDDFVDSVTPEAKLINALYKTIRDDLPIN